MPAATPGAAGCKQTSLGPWEPKIVWVKDSHGTAYHGPQGKLDLKQVDFKGREIKLRYAVHGQPQIINLWLQYQPSAVHQNFYMEYQRGDFKPPRVVWFVFNTITDPGEYEVTWNGRDDTEDHRLLLAGKYDVMIEGTVGSETKKDKTAIEIAKPRAVNFGFEYDSYDEKDKTWSLESTRQAPEDAADQQKDLDDGTAFDAQAQCAVRADVATTEMQWVAVASATTHAGPHALFFYSELGGAKSESKMSRLYIGHRQPIERFGTPKNKPIKSPNASLAALPWSAFRDMFLMLMNGCCAGNEVPRVKVILNSFDPGKVDGKHGAATSKALRNYQLIHKIKPADGKKNPETLKWFKINPSKSERDQTTELQTKLKSYYAGKVDVKDTLDAATSKAVSNYQRDHPKLGATGLLDDDTLAALQIGQESDKLRLSRNIADAMRNRGADLVLAFTHTVWFSVALDWSKEFWSQACKGEGIENAAKLAHLMIDRRYHRKCEMKVYAQAGVDRNSQLLPARYGKY